MTQDHLGQCSRAALSDPPRPARAVDTVLLLADISAIVAMLNDVLHREYDDPSLGE